MKNEKMIAMLLALVMVFGFAACGAPAAAQTAAQITPAAQSEAVPAPAGTQSGDAAYEVTVPVLSDIDVQLTLIHSQISRLLQMTGDQPWYYAVTDLDHDGNLEFIAASQHPQNRETNLKIWEVGSDRKTIMQCSVSMEEEETFPDLLTDSTDTFHDTRTDTWFYLFYDNVVLSDREVYTSKSAFNFKDGVISYEAFAVEHTVVENGARTVSYTDAEGNEISAKSYLESGNSAFADAERSNTGFEWLTLNEAMDFSRLVESYRVFMGERKPTENFPVPAPAALSYPEATPAPAATPAPTPAPTPTPDPGPAYLSITKNPTNEDRKIGSTARFVACANAFEALEWVLVSPSGAKYTPQQFGAGFSGATVSGIYSTTLSIENVSADMNNWGAYCVFRYKGQVASTSTAYIRIKDMPEPTPEPVPQGGSLSGYVSDFGYDYATILCPGYDYFTFNMNEVRYAAGSGTELYIGAPATVYYEAMGARGPSGLSCIIVGREPAPAPVEACQNGRAFREFDGRILVGFNDGSSIYLKGREDESFKIKVYGGTADELPLAGAGSRCSVYYRGELTAENVYMIEVYIEHEAEEEPEPSYEPVVDYETNPVSDSEPVFVPEPEPAAEPAPEPAPSEEGGAEDNNG